MIFPFKITNTNTNPNINTNPKTNKNTEITTKKREENIIEKQEWQRTQQKMVENESKSLRVSYGELMIEGELASTVR